MDFSVLATLLSLTMLSAMIGLLVTVLLLWVAPKNPLFEALESVREIIKGEAVASSPSRLPSKVPSKVPRKSVSVTPSPAPSVVSPPVAANSDRPVEAAVNAPPEIVNEAPPSSEEIDGQLDSLSYNRFLDGQMEGDQAEEVPANQDSAENEHETEEMEVADAREAVLQNELPTPSLIPEFEGTDKREDAAEGQPSPNRPSLIALDESKYRESKEELATPFGSRDTLISQEPERRASDYALGPSNGNGLNAWDGESQESPSESSRIELESNPASNSVHEKQVLGQLGDSSEDYLPSEPPLPRPEEWADLATPHISQQKAMVSERSTVAVGSWDSGASPEEGLENETVKGSGEQIFDDRQVVRGEGSRQLLSSSVNDLIENEAPSIRSNWELKPAEHKLGGADYAFADGMKEGDVQLDNRSDMNQPDVGFRGKPIKPKHVIIERDEDEPTADQLRLEALKNEDLRGVLMSIKNTDSDQFSTSITDLSEERGEGHRRHTSFYGSGAPRTETDTFGGTPHGSFRAWYDSGQAMVEGKYTNGNATGVWTLWDQQGNQLICAEISKVLNQWDYKAKVRYIETSKPAASS